MSRTALSAIEQDQGGALHPLMLANELVKAHVAVAALPALSDQPARVRRGAKVAAEWATLAATDAYQKITGRDPSIVGRDGKAGGPFLAYQKEVFDALGINPSPEAQARRLLEKTRPKIGI